MKPLTSGQVDVIEVSLAQVSIDHEIISSDELERSRRFAKPLHADRFLATRTSLRQILSQYVELPPGQLKITPDQHGKPAIAEESSLHFNLAHSYDLAMIAVASEAVGIDVEMCNRQLEPLAMAQRFFCPREYDLVASASDPDRQRLNFLRIWSAKEATLKLLGTGLRVDLSSFDAGDATDQQSFEVYPDRLSRPAYLHALTPANAVVYVATWNSNADISRQHFCK